MLAFDASCGTCREVSDAVAEACDGKLEVLSLAHPDVRRWREHMMGPEAPWAPTLLETRGENAVRAWVGKRMAFPLVRRIGMRSTMRVLNALGRLQQSVNEPLAQPQEPRAMSRKQFLRFGSGAAMVGGMLVAGSAPAFAEERRSAAAKWVAAHEGQLPQTYSEIIKYSMDYRMAIYRSLPVSTRAQLWSEQLKRYRAQHPALTAEQDAVLRRIEAACEKDSNFEFVPSGQPRSREEQELEATTVRAFGKDEARRLVATLGPPSKSSTASAAALKCSCSTVSDWCFQNYCYPGGCTWFPAGCGWFNKYECNGTCNPPA